MRDRMATFAVHGLGRARRDQHGHRCGAGHHQPDPGPAAARRHLRDPGRQPGAAGARGPRQPGRQRQRRASSPSRATGTGSTGPSSCRPPARRDARAHRPGRDRRGHDLSLPQDVQAEAYDWPDELFAKRVWHVGRPAVEEAALDRAVDVIRGARRPLIVAGGGVIYSQATEALRAFAEATGVPVAETQAGKGSLPYDHPQSRRCDRRDRHDRRQHAGQRSRRRDRHRHPLQRLHHRLADRLRRRRTCASSTSTSRRSTRTSCPPSALVADAREGLEQLTEALDGWSVDAGLPRARDRARPRVGRHRRSVPTTSGTARCRRSRR